MWSRMSLCLLAVLVGCKEPPADDSNHAPQGERLRVGVTIAKEPPEDKPPEPPGPLPGASVLVTATSVSVTDRFGTTRRIEACADGFDTEGMRQVFCEIGREGLIDLMSTVEIAATGEVSYQDLIRQVDAVQSQGFFDLSLVTPGTFALRPMELVHPPLAAESYCGRISPPCDIGYPRSDELIPRPSKAKASSGPVLLVSDGVMRFVGEMVVQLSSLSDDPEAPIPELQRVLEAHKEAHSNEFPLLVLHMHRGTKAHVLNKIFATKNAVGIENLKLAVKLSR